MKKNNQSLISACCLASAILVGCGHSPSGAYLNNTQETFEGTRASFNKDYQSAQNEIKKSAVFNQANAWTKRFAKDNKDQIKDWRGIVKRISTDHGGDNAYLMVKAVNHDDPEIDYQTAQTDILNTSDTIISKDSPVYAELASLKEGDKIVFSGKFFPDDEKGITEGSLTEEGSLDNPEFLVRFSDIRKVDF